MSLAKRIKTDKGDEDKGESDSDPGSPSLLPGNCGTKKTTLIKERIEDESEQGSLATFVLAAGKRKSGITKENIINAAKKGHQFT